MVQHKRFKAFTMVEIMVVVAIVAIISVVAANSFRSSRAKARWSEAHNCLGTLSIRLENYRSNHGLYPCDKAEEDFTDVATSLNLENNSCGDFYSATVSIFNDGTSYVITACDSMKPIWSDSVRDVWVLTDESDSVVHFNDAINDLDADALDVKLSESYKNEVTTCN